MICSIQNDQLMQTILKSSSRDIKKLLQEEDNKYIAWRKQQIIENMPHHLKPNHQIKGNVASILRTIVNDNNPKKISNSNVKFPLMFQQKCNLDYYSQNNNKKTLNKNEKQSDGGQNNRYNLQRINELIGQNKSQSSKYNQLQFQTQKLSNQQQANELYKLKKLERQNPNDFTLNNKQNGVLDNNMILDNDEFMQNQQQLQDRSGVNNSDFAKRNPFVHPSKYSPFIHNQTNFLDVHTNKKSSLQSYLTPEVYSMNLLQYAHIKKQQNTFNDTYSYPNAVMGNTNVGIMKTAKQMRTNPFSKTFNTSYLDKKKENYQTQNNNQISHQNGQFGSSVPNQFNKNSIVYQNDYNKPNQNYHYQYQEGTKFLGPKGVDKSLQFRSQVQNVLRFTLNDPRYTAHTAIQKIDYANLNGNVNYKEVNKNISPASHLMSTINDNKRQRYLQNPFVRRPHSNYKK